MRSHLRALNAVVAIAAALVTTSPAVAAAQSDSGGTGPFGPFAGYTLDPLGPSEAEDVTPLRQPDSSQLPAFNTYFGSGMLNPSLGRYVSVAVGADANGGQRVYVASSTTNRVYVFDGHMPINPPSPPQPLSTFGTQAGPGTLQGVAGIAFYRAEVYVVDRYLPNPGQDRVVVYDAAGGYKRSFPLVNPRGVFDMTGVDVMANEVWITGELCGGLGGVVEIYDAATGALKGIVPHLAHAPTGSLTKPCDETADASAWWDMALVPELNAGIAQYRLIDRGLLAQLSMPDAELACLQCFRRLWQDGTDAVPGMRWFLSVDGDSALARGTGITEYSIDPMLASGQPFLQQRRRWAPMQAGSGGVRDIAYQKRDTRIDWDGNLTRPDWQHNDAAGHQCLQYVVSDADIFAAGDNGEHWWDLAKVQKIEFYVDGTLQQTILNSAIGQYCLDESPFASGVHDLMAKAYVEDGAKIVTAENPDLHIDHDPPSGAVDSPGQWARGTVTITGSMSDVHSGARDWELQANGPATGGAWQNVCAPSTADQTGKYSCQWDTTRYADGAYQLRAQVRDNVEDPFGGPNIGYTVNQAVTVDNTPPSVDNMAPDLNELEYENVGTDNTNVEWTQNDPGSGIASTSVDYYTTPQDSGQNGQWANIGSSGASGEASVPWNVQSLEGGLYKLRARACDQAGNCADTNWQASVLARSQRFQPGCVLVNYPHCYAGESIGSRQAPVPQRSGGVQAQMLTPRPPPHQSRSDVSADYVTLGPLPTLQTGLTTPASGSYPTENCGRFTGARDNWYQYVEFLGRQKAYINCVARSGQGNLHSYEVKIIRYSDGDYYAHAYIDGNVQVIERLRNRRTFRLGRGGTKGAQVSAEVSNVNREMTGYFYNVKVQPNVFVNSWVTPDVGLPFHDAGFVRYGSLGTFCASDTDTAAAKGCTAGFR